MAASGTRSVNGTVPAGGKAPRITVGGGERKWNDDGAADVSPGFRSGASLLLARAMEDRLQLEVHDMEVPVLTGIYSEETHLPQPLRISITADLECPRHFAPDTPLSASKSYIDLKHAATAALPPGRHFTLIEAVADHICETLFLADERVLRVTVRIVKLAIAEANESIGITLVRHRR